jgi:hypothetical protein
MQPLCVQSSPEYIVPAARLNSSLAVVVCLLSGASTVFSAACFWVLTDAVMHEADGDAVRRP